MPCSASSCKSAGSHSPEYSLSVLYLSAMQTYDRNHEYDQIEKIGEIALAKLNKSLKIRGDIALKAAYAASCLSHDEQMMRYSWECDGFWDAFFAVSKSPVKKQSLKYSHFPIWFWQSSLFLYEYTSPPCTPDVGSTSFPRIPKNILLGQKKLCTKGQMPSSADSTEAIIRKWQTLGKLQEPRHG